MIINDIILENRALNPDELNIVSTLKSKGSNAGDMFSEVGPFLTVNQFKCLTRWIVAANMATVVKRRNESETFENDQLLLEFEILFGRTNFTTLNEGSKFEMVKGIFNMFGKNIDDFLKPMIKKINPKSSIDDIATKIEIPKDLGKPLTDLTSAGKPMVKPSTKTIAGQTDELVKLEANLTKEVEKKLGREIPKELAGNTKQISKEATEGFLYKSGLRWGQFKQMVRNGPGKLSQFIKNTLMTSIRTLGMATATLGGPLAATTAGRMAAAYAAGERVKSGRRATPAVHKRCDADAHNIRDILSKHGWIMSSTPTGY